MMDTGLSTKKRNKKVLTQEQKDRLLVSLVKLVRDGVVIIDDTRTKWPASAHSGCNGWLALAEDILTQDVVDKVQRLVQ